MFFVPQSRHTEVLREDIEKVPGLGYFVGIGGCGRIYRGLIRRQANFRDGPFRNTIRIAQMGIRPR